MENLPKNESQFEDEDTFEQVRNTVQSFLEETTDTLRNSEHLYELHELSRTNTSLRFQPVVHNIDQTLAPIGPGADLVEEIVAETNKKLRTYQPDLSWENAVTVQESQPGTYVIAVELLNIKKRHSP